MRTGTKSLLFGVHQFIWHPVTVYLAWIYLYRSMPSIRETICIIIHDWGYWGKYNMDDADGEKHPELAAKIAGCLLGQKYHDLCLYHSRHYARNKGIEPSKLCWADKYSIMFESWWTYLPRAWISGELREYRKLAADAGFIPISASDRVWFAWVKSYLKIIGKTQKGNVVGYMNSIRKDIK